MFSYLLEERVQWLKHIPEKKTSGLLSTLLTQIYIPAYEIEKREEERLDFLIFWSWNWVLSII